MFKLNKKANNELLMQALKHGLIGSGIGGAALGGMQYLTDDTQDPAERNQKLRNSAMLGMGLGGVAGAGLGSLMGNGNPETNAFAKSPIYKTIRGWTLKNDAANAGLATAGIEGKRLSNNIKDKNFWQDSAKDNKFKYTKALGQSHPLESKSTINDPARAKSDLLKEFMANGRAKPFDAGRASSILDNNTSTANHLSNEGINAVGEAERAVKAIKRNGPLGGPRFSEEGLQGLVNSMHVPQAELDASGMDMNILNQNRRQALGNMADHVPGQYGRKALGMLGGLLGQEGQIPDALRPKSVLNMIQSGDTGIGNSGVGRLGKALRTGGLSYALSKGLNGLAPHTTDPLMADPAVAQRNYQQFMAQQAANAGAH